MRLNSLIRREVKPVPSDPELLPVPDESLTDFRFLRPDAPIIKPTAMEIPTALNGLFLIFLIGFNVLSIPPLIFFARREYFCSMSSISF